MLNIYIRIILCTFCTLIVSCSDDSNKFHADNKLADVDLIQNRVAEFGDTSAYNRLKEAYEFTGTGLLFYSIIMANNYELPEAHLDVFKIILANYVSSDMEHFYQIDSSTRKLMTYHLDKAVQMNVKEAYHFSRNLTELDSLQEPGKSVIFHDRFDSEKEFQLKVLYEGDTIAYKELRGIPPDFELSPERLLFWSIIMANRYDYREAFLDVFICFYKAHSLGYKTFESLDQVTKDFALTYFDRAVEKGFRDTEYFDPYKKG